MSNETIKHHQYVSTQQRTRRPFVFVAAGVFLFAAAALIMRDHLHAHSVIAPAAAPYSYSIQQSVDIQTLYRPNSFFNTTPDLSDTAFITDLTDSITAHFHYSFHANESTDLAYQYQASAVIQAVYGSDNSTEGGRSNVWSKQFTLSPPVKASRHDKSFALDPDIVIPFGTYKKQMEQFRTAFSAPVNSEMVVTYNVQLSGSVHGIPLKETKISTITVPLDQQVFKLSTKYEKSTHNEIVLASSKRLQDVIAKLEIPIAFALILTGLASTVYGFRKQMIKSPYQRKLEKIYRYHDGIIVRASQPPELAHKNIVAIKSFDDMLSLEEELKTPIIASTVNDDTTHFIITRDDIAYVYTLGVQIPFKIPSLNSEPHEEQRPSPGNRVSG